MIGFIRSNYLKLKRRSEGCKNFTNFAGVAQLVEHHVANVDVVGSKPIARSKSNSSAIESMADEFDPRPFGGIRYIF